MISHDPLVRRGANSPTTVLGPTEEVEHRQHDHEEGVGSQRGSVDKIRVQEGVPHFSLLERTNRQLLCSRRVHHRTISHAQLRKRRNCQLL